MGDAPEPEVLYERMIEVAGWPWEEPKKVRVRFVRSSAEQRKTGRFPKGVLYWLHDEPMPRRSA